MFAVTGAEEAAVTTSRDVAINSLTALLAGLTGRLPLPEHVGFVVDSIIEAGQCKCPPKKEGK